MAAKKKPFKTCSTCKSKDRCETVKKCLKGKSKY